MKFNNLKKCFLLESNDKIKNKIKEWELNYLNQQKNKHKIKLSLNNILDIVNSKTENYLMMDKITKEIESISRNLNNKDKDKMLNDLTKIIELL